MHNTDQRPFFEILIGVAAIYGKELSVVAQMLYWQCLQQYELDVVRSALRRHVTDVDSGQYMPKPADIVRQIVGSNEDRALLAWVLVEKAMKRVGGYQSVAFDDLIIHTVIRDLGGWIKLCQISYDELPFRRIDFLKLYSAYAKRQSIPAHEPMLIGLVNADRQRQGLALEAPIRVGADNTPRRRTTTIATQAQVMERVA